MQPRPVRILIVDDHAVFREPIAHVLSANFGFEVTHCGTPAEAVRALDRSAYDLVLLDFDLGNETGTTVIGQLRQAGYDGRIVILSAGVSDYAAATLAAAGVCGIVRKTHSIDVLVERIQAALRGEPCSDAIYEAAMSEEPGTMPRLSSHWTDLSPRERNVLRCLIRGKANKEIAGECDLSEDAVKSTMKGLFKKTGSRTRSELVGIALKQYSKEL
jgi:two-component system, NarL family, nitrate/nitrite response regulator NarL